MESVINFSADVFVMSQSDQAPFMVGVESGDGMTIVSAILPTQDDPKVVCQETFDFNIESKDIVVRWAPSGVRAGVLFNERLTLIFDFKKSLIYSEQLISTIESDWARQLLQFSKELAVEFGLDQFFKQPELDNAIDALVQSPDHTHRLLFYKALLRSVLFVPITTASPDDPNTLIYMFPAPVADKDASSGQIICGYTNVDLFKQEIGQYGLSSQKISSDFLCLQAQSFDEILGITITSSTQKSVLLSRDEFKLLALISRPQRLDTQTLLRELGEVFFEDCMDDRRDQVRRFYESNFQSESLIRAGYFCFSNVQKDRPLFCLVLKSTAASDALSNVVQIIKDSDLSSFCDFHLFSLSDVVAKALAQSKTPIATA